jgi:hypothetical protein
MDTTVPVQVHPRERLASAAQYGPRKSARLAREREDAAVVIGVDVYVEQPRTAGLERGSDRVDRAAVAPL